MHGSHRAPDTRIRMNYLLARLCIADQMPVTKEELVREVNGFLGQKVGKPAIVDTLRTIRDLGIPGFTLTIGKEDVTLKRRDTIIVRERQKKYLSLKRKIGIVLWEVLLKAKNF